MRKKVGREMSGKGQESERKGEESG
jgi:hypothetical protein